MTNDDLYDAFSDDKIEEYKKEAKERWGHTKAYQQSVQRTKHWTKADYNRIAKEGADLTKAIAEARDKGVESPLVQELIDQHYKYVSMFYDCPYEMYRNLGKMYVEDKRFTAYYEKFGSNLAEFMRDAIAYYCDQQENKTVRA